MDFFAYTCSYREIAITIKRCYKLFHHINQCIIVVPINLWTIVMCPRTRFTQVYYHGGEKKKPSTFKCVFLSDISAGIICRSKSFRNRSFIYKRDTGSLRLPIPLQTIDDMVRVCMQLPSSTEYDRSSYCWQPIFSQEELQWTHFLLVAEITLIYWSTT